MFYLCCKINKRFYWSIAVFEKEYRGNSTLTQSVMIVVFMLNEKINLGSN
ncbi:protein of unknown function [Mycoplasma capricolum subsp. capripneumoniae]|nr:protein of unknown function [Mycoplasma capricolum subsp. capripneumoniae]